MKRKPPESAEPDVQALAAQQDHDTKRISNLEREVAAIKAALASSLALNIEGP